MMTSNFMKMLGFVPQPNLQRLGEVMSDPIGPEFWARADSIIKLANEQSESAPTGKVSSSLLYAAARFNAFNVASKSASLEELKTDKEEAIAYFTEQYRKMLIENLDDYIDNYERYLGGDGGA